MEENDWKKGNYVFNNYPYHNEEIQAWKSVFGNMVPAKMIIEIEATDDKCLERMKRRAKLKSSSKDHENGFKTVLDNYDETSIKEMKEFYQCQHQKVNGNLVLKNVTS